MIVKINVELIIDRNGVVKIRHEIPEPDESQNRVSIFGFTKEMLTGNADIETINQIMAELPSWIRHRFLVEARSAVIRSLPPEVKETVSDNRGQDQKSPAQDQN